MLAFVRELDPVDVVGSGTRLFGDGENLFYRDVNEFRIGIDKAPDQPRAGYSIDLGVLSGHPLGRSAKDSAGWQASLVPGGNAAFEIARGNSTVTQRRGRASA